ncbi:MAG: type transport system ATP-binding protein [Candidatus Parcubacteria bacterium]|jgi:ABC-2 type transport system ATP-binding protein|nr:type transport system ATP-binding protein [Candidatus Parcubacteria bacterium]
MNSTAPAILIKDVRKTYDLEKGGKTEALKGVSLSIPRGEFFSLLGPNGAGKTTLISIATGLANKTSGTVEIEGVSIDEDPSKAKTFIGLVPQEMNFDIFEKVINIIIYQAGYYGITKREAMPYAEELLKQLGLWEKRNDKAETLSGGMKRRLLIARALIHKPAILLLDEPTAGVDVELRRGMWDFLRELNASGTTIVLTTHYLEEAEQLSRKVAIINKGEIIEEGSVKELLSKLNYVTLLVDTVETVTVESVRALGESAKRIDEHTIELTLPPGGLVNDAFKRLSDADIRVANVRNPGSRLEEVFLHLINN